MSGHFHLNPPPYHPGPIKFFGVPDDENGSIVTDEQQQAYNVIRQFGAQGPQQQAYVKAYFNGDPGPGSAPAPQTYQLNDISEFFSGMSPQALKAVNLGCANVLPEFITGMKIAFGLDANGNPVNGVGACQSTTVQAGTEGSQYRAICDAFQHNLNVGGHGGP